MTPDPQLTIITFDPHVTLAILCLVGAVLVTLVSWILGLPTDDKFR